MERVVEARNWSQAHILYKMISVLRGIEWQQRGYPKTVRKPSKTFRNLQKPSKPYTPACVRL
eukprot:8415982-Heterocapsa_arctica.AAC.1